MGGQSVLHHRHGGVTLLHITTRLVKSAAAAIVRREGKTAASGIWRFPNADRQKHVRAVEFARTCEGGRERRGLSAHSPSPRAQHPNPRLRIHAKPRRPPERDGEKWMTPFHTPQAESRGL